MDNDIRISVRNFEVCSRSKPAQNVPNSFALVVWSNSLELQTFNVLICGMAGHCKVTSLVTKKAHRDRVFSTFSVQSVIVDFDMLSV